MTQQPAPHARARSRRKIRSVAALALLSSGALSAVMGSAPGAGAAAPSPPAPAVAPVAAPGIMAPPDVVVGAADGSVSLPVTLTAPGTSTVTVNYDTPGETTSSNGSCYGTGYGFVGQSGTLTFLPGVTSQTVRVPLLNCGTSYSSGFQVFSLSLYSNSSDSSIVRSSTQIDITGDAAAASKPGLYVRDAVVDDSAGTIDVPVVLGGPSGAASGVAVTVPYTTHDGSALAGTDYTTTSGTLTFPPGETAQNIAVPIIHRTGAAPTRNFSVTLGTPTNATVADGTGVVTIEASGQGAATAPGISAPADLVASAADGYVDLPVTLTSPGFSTVTVNYDTPGETTSSNGSCYGTGYGFVGQSGTLTFLPGVTSQTVRVPLLNCGTSYSSGFQVFSLSLYSNSSDSSIVRSSTQIDITGDAAAASKPGLYVRDAVVDDSAGTIDVPVVLGGPSGAASGVAVTVPYTTHDGSALAGTDYTTTSGTLTFPPGETAQNIAVPIIHRTGAAPTRNFSVTLGTPTNATVADGTGVVTIEASGQGAATAPGISAPADLVASAADGYVDLPVTLTSPGFSTVTVNYDTPGETTSSNGSCYGTGYGFVGQSGTLTFLPGVTSQTVRVPLLNCGTSYSSGFQVFSLSLYSNSSDSSIVRSSTQIDITGDAAAASKPGLYVRDAVVDDSAGTIDVPVVLGGPSGAASGVAVTVPYTTHDGSALAGTDYTTTSGTLTFPPGETAQNIAVPIIHRTGAAPTRNFSVTLGTPTNATVADGTGVVTIEAAHAGAATAPKISAPAAVTTAVTEGYVDLPVTLSASGASTVTVNYDTPGGTTSSNGSCYGTGYGFVGQSGTLTFRPGVTTRTVRIPLLSCGQTAKGTFSLDLYSNSSDSTIARATTTVTELPKATKPGAPRTVTAVAGAGAATVSFTAPASDGGDPLNDYTVTASPGGATATGITTSLTVGGLTSGTSYTFTVTATNALGTGPASVPSIAVVAG